MNLDVDMDRVINWTKNTMEIIGAEFRKLSDITFDQDEIDQYNNCIEDYFFDKINRGDINRNLVKHYVNECIKFQ